MKKLLALFFIFFSMSFANAEAVLKYKIQGMPFCGGNNTWSNDDIICPGAYCNFYPSSLDFQVVFSVGDPGGTIGTNPYKMKVELFLNGNSVLAFNQLQTSSCSFSPTFLGIGIVSGLYRAKILLQKRNVSGWVDVATYWTNEINISLCPACGGNVIISGNPFTTGLTQSLTWIKTDPTPGVLTIVPAGANVKLDAHPAYGYIELNPGFEVVHGALFIARAIDGCGPLIP